MSVIEHTSTTAESLGTEWLSDTVMHTVPAKPHDVNDDGIRRRVVWKFGGTSVGDVARMRAIAARLVAARRDGFEVVAVLSAMAGSTDELVRLACELSSAPDPRELDALMSVGESISCALVAMAVRELGERAVSLNGQQAGVHTDSKHGTARVLHIDPARILEALAADSIVLVTGFQGVCETGDVTTLGRGGSDASAIALAAALGLQQCDIFTDVTGVWTADPRIVPSARKLESVSHEEMLQLSEAGARVLQIRAVELAASYGVDIHVRSSFTFEPGTWVRNRASMFEESRVCGVAHVFRDPLYTAAGTSASAICRALADRGVAVGSMTTDRDGTMYFTAPGIPSDQLLAALARVDADVRLQDDLGSVSVISARAASQFDILSTALTVLESIGIAVRLLSRIPNRVSCHVPSEHVELAARSLHDAFWPDGASATIRPAQRISAMTVQS